MSNKKVFIAIALLLALGITSYAFAEDEVVATPIIVVETEEADVVAEATIEDSSPGILPTNPFYFMDKWMEKLRLAFAFGDTKKAEVRLQQASERFSELNSIISDGDVEIIKKIERIYQAELTEVDKAIQDLESKNKNAATLIEKFDNLTARHRLVMQGVLNNAPETEKKD